MMKKTLALAVFGLSLTAASGSRAADAYTECMQKAAMGGDDAIAVCMENEAEATLQDIKTEYEKAAKDNIIGPWSNGIGMKSGNLRTLFEEWLAYRNRYCEAYMTSLSDNSGTTAYNRAQCLMDMTNQHLRDISALNINAHSTVF